MVTMPTMGVYLMPQAVVTTMVQPLLLEMLWGVATIWLIKASSSLRMVLTLELLLLE